MENTCRIISPSFSLAIPVPRIYTNEGFDSLTITLLPKGARFA